MSRNTLCKALEHSDVQYANKKCAALIACQYLGVKAERSFYSDNLRSISDSLGIIQQKMSEFEKDLLLCGSSSSKAGNVNDISAYHYGAGKD